MIFLKVLMVVEGGVFFDVFKKWIINVYCDGIVVFDCEEVMLIELDIWF